MNKSEIRNKMSKVMAEITEEFENETSPIEWDNNNNSEFEELNSYDGFMMFPTIAFRTFSKWNCLSLFDGTGYRIENSKIDAKIEKMIDYNYELASENFNENNKEWIAENNLKEDQLNYSDLYDFGYGDKAEELSNIENDYMSEDCISCEIEFYYYDSDNHCGSYPNYRNDDGNGSFMVRKVYYFDEYNKVMIDNWSVEFAIPKNCNDERMGSLIEIIKNSVINTID